MQVALVCNSAFGTDGISMFVLNNHRYFKHDGTRYHLIYSSIHSPNDVVDGYVKDFESGGDNVAFISKGRGLMTYAWNFYRYLRREKIDVLHVHGSSSAILIEMIVAKLAGVLKIITHCHSTRGNHNIIHKILRPAVNWLSNEKLACGELAGKWMYGKHGKFRIIPNCIDTEKYKYDESIRNKMRKELGINDDTLLIGHVGVFSVVKNQKFLIHIIKQIKQQGNKSIKLALIGDGSLKEQAEQEVKSLGLSEDVLFLGNRNDVPQIMMAMDVFCLPSLYEGFPIVSVEAQASGLPTFLSKNISPEVCITDLVKLLPIEEPKLWIRSLENQSYERSKRYAYAQKIMVEGYNIKKSALKLESIYKG